MVDIAALKGAYDGLKAAKEMFNGFIDAKADGAAKLKIQAVVEKVEQAQSTLYQLRDELYSLQQKNNELRLTLDAVDAWKQASSEYAITTTDGGAVVYKYKGEPPHYACPSCFNKKEIQFLQDNRTLSGKFRCTGCKAEYPINPAQRPPVLPPSNVFY